MNIGMTMMTKETVFTPNFTMALKFGMMPMGIVFMKNGQTGPNIFMMSIVKVKIQGVN